MKKMHLVFGAMVAMAAVAAPAQSQSVSATTGTTSSVSAIDESILSNQMGGLKVTGVFDDNGPTTGFDFWRDLSGVSYGSGNFSNGTWGADIRSTGGTRIATVYMGGSSNTYSNNWNVRLYSLTNLRSLTFEGGAAFGNVMFDRSNGFIDNCGGNEGTCGSDVGRDFDMSSDWSGITARYSNAVQLNGANARNDLYTSVFVDFQNAVYDCGWFCLDSNVPDSGNSPFQFRMDTDKGTFSRVPEPSSAVLMAAGLFGMVGFARRRNLNA